MIWLFACTSPELPDSEAELDSTPPPTVVGTFDIRNAQNGNGRSGIELAHSGGSVTTDEAGRADLLLEPDAQFNVVATGGAMLPHYLVGDVGSDAFTFTTFKATQNQTDQVLSYLGATWEPGTGIVVVGIDTPDPAPVYGASAAIDAESDMSFVFGASLPEEGDTLVEGGSSIVSFLNVTPDIVWATVTPPADEDCAVFPARTNVTRAVQMVPDAVSVVVFTCE
ncbi:MAG: hypothetical protein GY884_23745 [Proteobacteria bacterium]|nr:hypothetical protein [Pseudomonadota bacterium]